MYTLGVPYYPLCPHMHASAFCATGKVVSGWGMCLPCGWGMWLPSWEGVWAGHMVPSWEAGCSHLVQTTSLTCAANYQ